MATPSLQWDASLVSLKVTTASGGIITMAFPDRATDVSFNMPPTGFSNPLTTKGDLAIGDVDGFPARLAIGTDGQVLQSDGTTAVWTTLSYITNPMTTAQDLIVGGTSGAPGRLAVGAEGKVLGVSSGAVAWVTPSTGFANPMTAVGDLILGGTDGAAGRLAIGTTGKVLTSNGTTATWEAPVTGFSNPMTTLGDIITADAGGTAKRVGVGTEGQVLKVVSGEPGWGDGATVAKDYLEIRMSNAQTIPSNEYTILKLEQVISDTNSIYNTTTHRVTIKKAGIYLITSKLSNVNATQNFQLSPVVNGGTTDVANGHYATSSVTVFMINTTFLFSLAVSDYIEFKLYHYGGGNMVNGSPSYIRMIGPL